MRKILFINMALLALMTLMSAQAQTVVTGTVLSSDDGTPLPGVNILIKNTTAGTVTDVDGNYRLEVPNENTTLVFSFVGYTTQEILVGTRSVIDLSLVPDVSQLEEIIIVGYGTLQEKDLTSAITTIKTEDIVKTPTAQAMQALQGKVPGLQVVSSGAPGAAPTVLCM